MKTRFNKKKIAAVLVISSLALLTGCGKSADSGAAGVVPGLGAGNPYGVGGCVPISSSTQIPFTATNMYFGNSQMGDMRVMAGNIPYKQAFGQVMIGGGLAPVTTPYGGYGGSGQFRGQRVDGTTISLSLTSGGTTGAYPGYPPSGGYGATGNVSATGTIQVSPFIQSVLMQAAASASGYGGNLGFPTPSQYPTQYPGQYPGQAYPGQTGIAGQNCISSLAIDLQHTISSQWLYLGSIYFFVNGTQHGLALDF